jgi:hypothetical protein
VNEKLDNHFEQACQRIDYVESVIRKKLAYENSDHEEYVESPEEL